MRPTILIVSLMAIVLSTHFARAQQVPMDSASTWVNQLGSSMTITVDSTTGAVTGAYISKVGCGAGSSFPVTGWFNDGAITFTVNWKQCDSLTAWTGHTGLQGSQLAIVTLWYLAIGGTVQWNSTVAGTDTFIYQQ